MLEGDIVLTPELKGFLRKQRDGKEISPFDAAVRNAWPGGRVPYTFARYFRKYLILIQQKRFKLKRNSPVVIHPRPKNLMFLAFFENMTIAFKIR